jgi:hypothetical protein
MKRSDLARRDSQKQCFGNSEGPKAPVVDGRSVCHHCGKSIAVRYAVFVAHHKNS